MANTLSATTAVAVEELAAQMEITTTKLRLAIGLAAAAKYTLDLGLGIQVKVTILDEVHLCDEAVMELAHIESLDFRDSRQIFMETPAASEQHQSLLAAPPAVMAANPSVPWVSKDRFVRYFVEVPELAQAPLGHRTVGQVFKTKGGR